MRSIERVAVYPGSFNPFHQGHADIVKKAFSLFDFVVIAVGVNPDKKLSLTDEIKATEHVYEKVRKFLPYERYPNVRVEVFAGLLVDFIKERNEAAERAAEVDGSPKTEVVAVMKGLRNGQDLEYERAQQMWNEDLGITVPTVYFISDRRFIHVSSSAIRALKHFKK